MSYFFGNAYRGFKWTVSGVGGVGGTAGVVYGAATGGTGAIVVGSLLATQSLIFYVDNYRTSRDLHRYIDEQRNVWTKQKNELNSLIGEYRSEHENFLKVVGQSTQQIDRLKALQSDMSEDHERETARYRAQLDKVQERLETLGALEKRYREQNAALTESLHRATEQAESLQLRNEELCATEEALKEQVVKLRDLHEQSKQLLRNLVLAGDAFTSFGKQFGSATDRLDSTTDRVEEGVDDLQNTLALLKDVATHLHTEHVRSLGAAFDQPAGSSGNSTFSDTDSLASSDEVQSDVESFFDDEEDGRVANDGSDGGANPLAAATAAADWISEWANKTFATAKVDAADEMSGVE